MMLTAKDFVRCGEPERLALHPEPESPIDDQKTPGGQLRGHSAFHRGRAGSDAWPATASLDRRPGLGVPTACASQPILRRVPQPAREGIRAGSCTENHT